MIAERPAAISVGPGLELQGRLAAAPEARRGVVVCHPHPLYGGDLDNPVVAAVVSACAAAGLATLRFNFRGVGASGGAWDEGRGEQDDVRAALTHLRGCLAPGATVALAGYSFGAAMAAAVAADGTRLAGLALVAPPLAMRPWQPRGPLAVDGPLLLVAGGADEYCPRDALLTLGRALAGATVTVVDDADHFFATGLGRLADAIATWASAIS